MDGRGVGVLKIWRVLQRSHDRFEFGCEGFWRVEAEVIEVFAGFCRGEAEDISELICGERALAKELCGERDGVGIGEIVAALIFACLILAVLEERNGRFRLGRSGDLALRIG